MSENDTDPYERIESFKKRGRTSDERDTPDSTIPITEFVTEHDGAVLYNRQSGRANAFHISRSCPHVDEETDLRNPQTMYDDNYLCVYCYTHYYQFDDCEL